MSRRRLPEPRPGVFSTKLYQPGRPLEEVLAEYGLSHAHKLASNENLFGVSPRALAALQAATERVNYYPDNAGVHLSRQVASHCGVEVAQVALGNGTVELIYDLVRAYVAPGDQVVMGTPSFSAYPIATRVQGGEAVEVPLTPDHRLDLPAMAAAVGPRTKLVFLPNPNNPTGTLVDRDEVETFLQALPEGVLVVLDEAYHDYIRDPGYPDSLGYFRAGAPVAILRSLSKSLGIAGLRIGYGVVPESVQAALRQVQVPFHCSLPAQAAAMAGLEDQDFVAESCRRLEAARAYLVAGLAARGLESVPSHANFVMLRPGVDPRAAAQGLMRRGLIVRPGEDLGAPGWLRVTVGPEAIMEEFLVALDQVRAELAGQPPAVTTGRAGRS